MSERVAITKGLILETARVHGIKLRPSFQWFSKERKCGCGAGLAAIARMPSLAERSDVSPWLIYTVLGVLSHSELWGLSDGFEGEGFGASLEPFDDEEVYRAHYAIGVELRDELQLGEEVALVD